MNRLSKMTFNIYGVIVLRVLLGGVFIFAGMAKLSYVNTLTWEIQQYRILPDSLLPVLARCLPPIEILIGTFLIVGMFTRISSLGSVLLLNAFTIAKASALLRGLDIKTCPCFGPSVILHSPDSLALGLLMLVFAFFVFFFDTGYLSLDSLINLVSEKRKLPNINLD